MASRNKEDLSSNCRIREIRFLSLILFKQGEIDSLANSLSLEGIAVSASSACDSEHDETAGDFNPSHVLVALGLSEFEIRCTIRISFNIKTTIRDIDRFIAALHRIVLEHQIMSALNFGGEEND